LPTPRRRGRRITLLAACRRIQERDKPLLIVSELSNDEYREFSSALDPAGLAIQYWERSVTG
jgi:hypothetical protein